MGDDTVHFAPDCAHGKGKMRIYYVGQFTSNPRRYYFKCLEGERHYNSFIWCDQLNRGKESTSSSSVLPHPISTPTGEPATMYSQTPHAPAPVFQELHKRVSGCSAGRIVIEQPDIGARNKSSIEPNTGQVLWPTLVLIVFLHVF